MEVIRAIQDKGYIAVLAGGCVRDTLLGLEPKDYDIASDIDLPALLAIFPEVQPVGKAFGVYLVNGHEVASLRTEDGYSDGRHPDNVEFVNSLEEDSERRDFTINAMYYNPIKNTWHDFHNGQEDLQYGILRFVGKAEDRIIEDKIRMLRAVRFAKRFDLVFNIDALSTIQQHASKILDVAQERVGLEFNKIWSQVKYKDLVLDCLHQCNLLVYLIPEINQTIGCEQPPQFHPEGDVFKHTLYVLKNLPDNASSELCWAGLLHDVGKPVVKEWDEEDKRWRFNGHDEAGEKLVRPILERFRYPNEFIDEVSKLVKYHMTFQHVRRMKESKLKRFLSTPNFHWHLDLHKADCLGSHGDLDHHEFCVKKLAEFANEAPELVLPDRLVTGHDLIEMGIMPGPVMKPILEKAFDMQLEGKIREEILKEIMPV